MNFHDFIEDILLCLKKIKTIRHKHPHLFCTILHDAEPPQRFCIYLAQKLSIILCSEKENYKKNFVRRDRSHFLFDQGFP